MSIEQTLSFERLTSARISPDGRAVVYGVGRSDWQADRLVNELWIASAETGERYRLTTPNNQDGAARWSPDGTRISFLSDRGGTNQIYLIRASGGEAVRLTNVAQGVNAHRWSPDGRRIAFTASDPEPETMRARGERLGKFEVLESGRDAPEDFARVHLWAMDVPDLSRPGPAPQPVRLTQGDAFTINDFEWSPEGGRIAFSAVVDPSVRARTSADIYLLELDGGKVTKLVDTPGPDSYPMWSPDGREIAYETVNGGLSFEETSKGIRFPSVRRYEFGASNRYIAVVPATGGSPRLLTDQVDEQANLLAWGPDGIYLALQEKTNLNLYRLNPRTKAMSLIKAPDRLAHRQWSFTEDFRKMGFVGVSATSHPDLYVRDLRSPRLKRLTRFDDQFTGFRQGSREVISWRSSDGTLVEGVLTKPADFDPTKTYPLLVVIHGGPADISRPLLGFPYAYPISQFAARGAIVLQPNYRGSLGYGEAFRTPDPRTLSDYEDIISGIKQLVDRGLADRRRIGAMGWSQGGYLTALLATKDSGWIRAASAGGSVPNWLTYYTSGDAGYWATQWFRATPLEDPEAYRIKSPINYLKGAKTPILLQHGENDRRAPIAGAYEFYQMLRDQGVPVKMIVYKGAGHGLETPKGLRALMEHNYEWFSRWIWDEEPKTETGAKLR